MLKPIPPSTLDGIKRLAKKLRNELQIPLFQAQDLAATRAGYQNLRHAQAVLSNAAPQPKVHAPIVPKHRLYISARWISNATGLQGVEAWHVDLAVPHTDLVTPSQMNVQPALARLVPRAPDHFYCEYNFHSPEQAKGHVCRVLRTWQFMDATRLRPSAAHSRLYPGGTASNAIPGKDHARGWYDPVTQSHVMTDEPYAPSSARYAAQRADWAHRHGYDVLQPTWPGMYLPGEPSGTTLYLVASKSKGPNLAAMVHALNQLPPPPVEGNWQGQSIIGRGDFISPQGLAIAPAAPRIPATRVAAPAKRPPRPNSMPIATHEEIGRKLKAIEADTYMRVGVRNRLVQVQGTLDSCIQGEHPSFNLPLERLDNVYYANGPAKTFAKKISEDARNTHLGSLQEIRSTLALAYDTPRVRRVLGHIDQMKKSLQTWK
ncbi:DUF5623 domain-containing protein [Acidovorax sp. sic0104]|uniref:DUF5623 domain-containing protein n=1 Tax=Acidovorax sp. sic0104 TaxID=2854784 RepID=UPI001C47DAB5|nr:DUF5623 domain-containing protein [Acidovorax sp. sic0104]MBV7542010.1 DUF5623 domain-containing protein [Acidovorax sp. sic0104]